MIPATQRLLCSVMAILFLFTSCAPASPAPEDPAVAQLQQTVDALLAAQNPQATATPDLEKVQLQQTLDSLLAAQTAQSQPTEVQATQTPNPLQATVDALFATQNAQQVAQSSNPLQETVEALFATQNALSTQQAALEGPAPAEECVTAPSSTPVDPDAAPSIENLYPDNGETYGGKPVTIEGKNLISRAGNKATFCFGGLQATEVTCPNTGLCTMKTPAHPKLGFVDVSALLDGQVATVANVFEYIPSPTVSSVDPNSGPISGGTSVTIKGSGFSSNTKFFFGFGNQARTETCNASECTVITPSTKTDQDSVVWVQAVEAGAVSELDTSSSTRQTFRYVAPGKYACDAYLVSPGSQGPFRPKERFGIEWVVKNTGTNAWPAGQDVRFSSGSSGNMGTVSVVEIKRALQPKDTFTVSIDAIAPERKGTHHMTWVVSGQGCSLFVVIKVE